jgi:hypothetical protein
MDYTIKGQKVKIVGNDFVTSGGEAKIYRRNKTIYKIYHNPSEMIPDGKIYELQEIKQPKVLIPKEIINDSKGVRVGFTMDYIDNVTPLCKLFTNTFINQNNISNDTIIALISRMQETIKQIHAAKCIQVDGNELNYLVSEKNFMDCYFIDVNSYQTKSFPATVIMPSIRDWTAKKFNELTDWYSFAIIACQLFIGIHPFKGKHQNFKRHDMEKRMRANVSVFNSDTRLPKSVREFSRIPTNYMDWFINLFEKGKRELPPSRLGEVNVSLKYIYVTSTDNFHIEETNKNMVYDDTILDHSNINGVPVTRTKKSYYIGTDGFRVGVGVQLVHTPLRQVPTFVKIENGEVELKSLAPSIKVYPGSAMAAEKMMIVDNTIYLKNKGDLIETRFAESSQITNILLVSKKVWSISENSSQLFKNIIVEDLLGSKHVTVPLPDKIHSRLIRNRVVELDDYKVLNAKYDHDVAVFSVFNQKDKEYKLMVMTGVTKTKYVCRFINTVDMNEVNFVTLDNGIVILIYDDQMEIFSNNPDSSKIKVIKDKELSSSMKLCKRGVSTRFFTDNKLYSIGMK